MSDFVQIVLVKELVLSVIVNSISLEVGTTVIVVNEDCYKHNSGGEDEREEVSVFHWQVSVDWVLSLINEVKINHKHLVDNLL